MDNQTFSRVLARLNKLCDTNDLSDELRVNLIQLVVEEYVREHNMPLQMEAMDQLLMNIRAENNGPAV